MYETILVKVKIIYSEFNNLSNIQTLALTTGNFFKSLKIIELNRIYILYKIGLRARFNGKYFRIRRKTKLFWSILKDNRSKMIIKQNCYLKYFNNIAVYFLKFYSC